MTISARGIGKTVHSSDQAAFCALMVAARKQAGLTQHERARRLKRPQSFVAKYEGGEPTSHLLFIYYLEERPVGRLRLSLAHQNNSEASAVPDGRQPVSAKSFPLNDLVDINGDDYFSLSVGNLDIVRRLSAKLYGLEQSLPCGGLCNAPGRFSVRKLLAFIIRQQLIAYSSIKVE
jgi:transcriptional regulator with XRE-family HTH domain